jgi:hypothetical protein
MSCFSQKNIASSSPKNNFQQFYLLSKHFLTGQSQHACSRNRATPALVFLAFLSQFPCQPAQAQSLHLVRTARVQGLAGAETCLTGHGLGSANPAGLAGADRWFAHAGQCRPFGIKELAVQDLAFGHCSPGHGLALQLTWTGFSQYQEGQASCAGFYSLGRRLSIGTALHAGWLKILHYGKSSFYLCDVGLLIHCAPSLTFGWLQKNIPLQPSKSLNSMSRGCWQAGLRVAPVSWAALHLNYHKEQPWAGQIRLAVETTQHQTMQLRWGLATNPASMAFGLSLHSKCCILDYGVWDHTELGLTHSVCFSLFWGKK